MGIRRSRTFAAIALGALAVLALRPVPIADDIAEKLCAPARVLAEIAAPVRWLCAHESVAAQSTLARDTALARALLADEQAFARPSANELVRGRSLVHAEVVRRDPKTPDRVVVRHSPEAEIELGAPVVCGDTYVGCVRRIGSARTRLVDGVGTPALLVGEAEIELVSARDFRVGAVALVPGVAAADAARVHFVAGGLVEQRRRGIRPRILAVSAIEAALAPGLEVFVTEDDGLLLEPLSKLAEGYRLGTLVAWQEQGMQGFGVAAPLDYRDGLQHVFVLGAPERASTRVQLAQDPFDGADWIAVRFATPGNPSFWRATRTLLAGSSRGIATGAALASGADFVGVVSSAARWSARVRLLGDPGLALNAVARVAGVARPLPLGRIVTLGCDGGSSDVFAAWNPELGLLAAGKDVVLYTAVGDPLVPPGLRLGTATLPLGAASVLRLARAFDARTLASARVWLGPRTNSAEERP